MTERGSPSPVLSTLPSQQYCWSPKSRPRPLISLLGNSSDLAPGPAGGPSVLVAVKGAKKVAHGTDIKG